MAPRSKLAITPPYIFFSFIFLESFLWPAVTPQQPLAPALYVFGDSLFDSGNNNFLPTAAKANYPPYGQNFTGGATGRFTNGRTVADFIAEYLRLPYPPPYVSLPKSDWLTGFNYASGSCGILSETGSQVGACLSLDAQINLFHLTLKFQLPIHFNGPKDLSKYLSKSIFIVSIGNNDYINNYLLDPDIYGTRQQYTPQQFAQLLVHSLSRKLQMLYSLGARKMVVFELGPIGCIPQVAATTQHQGRQCNEDVNYMISLFNDGLGNTLKNLTSTLQGSYFVLGGLNGLGYDAVTNPFKYGLTDSSDPCCTTIVHGTPCIPDLIACSNPYQHYFWDSWHLTEATYKVLASHCINNSSACAPLSIMQLAQV
ncbi:hypothetical protein Dimus_034160 [Dionaea muscipula]